MKSNNENKVGDLAKSVEIPERVTAGSCTIISVLLSLVLLVNTLIVTGGTTRTGMVTREVNPIALPSPN